MKRIKSKFFRRRKRNALSQVKRPGTGISPESQKGNYMLTWRWPRVPISYMTRLRSPFSLCASCVVASDLQQRTEDELSFSLTILNCLDSETILNETCLVFGLSLCKPIPQEVHFSVNTTNFNRKKGQKELRMLLWNALRLTFKDTMMKLFKSGPSTDPKEARRRGRRAVAYLLWLQSR